MKKFGLFIGGKWVVPDSKARFISLNPATKKPVASFPSANEKDVLYAISIAKAAFPKWSAIPAPKRGEVLLRFASLLRKNKERLARVVTQEMGKVLLEARGDVQEAIDAAEYMAGEGRRLFGYTAPSELPNKAAFTVREPIGVCALITPWNFPVAIPAWKMMPALVCGNTVVFKPSSDTPLCAAMFVELLHEAGIPGGVVNMVTGSGGIVGPVLVQNPDVRTVSFTGNRETGEWIAKNAGVKKIGLELGGKNPIIIMDDADLHLALEGVLWGAFGTTGQRCTAASRVIVHEKVFAEFEKMLVVAAKKLRLGSGASSSADVGPLINQKALEKSQYFVSVGIKEGARLLCGGKRGPHSGFFFEPTVFSGVAQKMRVAREEIFGPIVCLIKVKNLAEAIKTANDVDYGLSASIYTKDISNAFKA
ncbi:MAG: aldehyde dehydrogenase family protein, partial [archaeon]